MPFFVNCLAIFFRKHNDTGFNIFERIIEITQYSSIDSFDEDNGKSETLV